MEFSGRDNVYMYGSIMGLTKLEIDNRFGEIVQFSELGDFIYQPLRTYSSGMIVRLAFSVAVHVDADILIVDEALAVGDAIFQHRCFRKIREMQAEGKTILYVGHDTEAVRNLCTQALLLDGGRIIERGDPNYVVNKYYALIAERERAYIEANLNEHGEIPKEDCETVYNFIQNLNTAKIVSPPKIPVCEETVEVNSTLRKVIFAHAPSSITYSASIEQGVSLSFAIGIMPGAWEKIPQGVKFDIDVLCDGNTMNLFSRVLQPKRNIGDRGWHNFIIPLEHYSGKSISIIFRTSGSDKDLSYCWSAWGWARLCQYSKKQESVQNENYSSVPLGITDEPEIRTGVRYGNKKAEIQSVELLDSNGFPKFSYKTGDEMIIRYKMIAHLDFNDDLTIGFIIRNKFTEIYGTNTRWKNCDLQGIKKGFMPIVNISMRLLLGTGTYSLTSAIAIVHPGFEVEVLDRMEDHVFFTIQNDEDMTGFADLNALIRIE
jgi:energy-coupling factor transporter ATP-binding protein EcfA2